MKIEPSSYIHSTAIVEKGASIGANSKVWHWVHICEGAIIGENCSFGQNVFVGNKVNVGNNVKIQNNVSIYDNVYLEDNVFCGPSMVFTNVINPRSSFSRKNEYEKTYVERGVTFGANSTVICGNRIGKHAFIGAAAVITKDVKPYALMVGNPAKQIGWMSIYGEKIPLPINGNGSWKCIKTDHVYILKNSDLSIED